MATYSEKDGAVIGKHTVRFSAPPVEPPKESKTGDPAPKSPYEGLVLKPNEVEVKAGTNTFNFERVPEGAAPGK